MTTITQHDVCADSIRGLAGMAVRLGMRLERWGRRAAEQPDRDELRLRHEARRAVEREQRTRVALYGRLH